LETRSIPKSKTEVCLVQMPYSPIHQPSVALSLLKAALNANQITATVFYANFLWAEEIGLHLYSHLFESERAFELVPEWAFSGVAFPDFKPDHNEYFRDVHLSLQDLEHFLQSLDEYKGAQETLWKLRRLAPKFIDRAAQAILNMQPRIVGCTSMFFQHCSSLALLKRIKELNQDIVTVIGGANCESSRGVVTHKKCSWVDFVVSGEADMIFPKLCRQVLASGLDLSLAELPDGVLGPAHRYHEGREYVLLEQFPPKVKIENMNDVPTPDYDDYFTSLQVSSIGDMIFPGLPFETSRGCWWGDISHCAFCGINDDKMNYRSKEPERVISELEFLSQRYKTKNFLMVDNILDMQYFKTVIPTLAKQYPKYNIFYEIKANLKREQVQKMAEAGIRWIQPGIETLDNTLLKKMNKGTTVHQNIQLMKWVRENGIYNSWIMVYDIPGETDDIYLKLIDWLPKISHLQPPYRLTLFEYHRFSPSHTQQTLFGLNLSPHRSYSYVYPWDEQALEKFAYFFYDSTKKREQIDRFDDTGVQRVGLRALRNGIKNWRKEWNTEGEIYLPQPGVEPATLVMSDDGEKIEITDTRQCAVQPKFYLTGLSRKVYDICEQAHKQEGILRKLQSKYDVNSTWETIEPIVRELCEKGLLLELDGYFLSLALRGPLKPLPSLTNYPGGNIASIGSAKIRKLLGNSK